LIWSLCKLWSSTLHSFFMSPITSYS
jgi:hypothetical protein